MKKIHIALMTQTIDGRQASGTALVATKCIEALLAHPDEFELTFLHFEHSGEDIYKRGVREIVFPTFRARFLNRRFFRQIYFFLTTKERFDIIHWFQPRLYPFFWLAPATHIVVTVHGAGDFNKDLPFILSRFVHNWTLRLFQAFVSGAIAGSTYAKKEITEAYGIPPEKVHVVNNGVERVFARASLSEIEAVKKKYHLPQKFFLGVARLIPSKNVMRMFGAFDRFSREHPEEGLHFVNIGAKGSEREAIDTLIAHSRHKERFHLVTYVEQQDLALFYSAAFALVFPLLNEGFGLPAIEAMACGTPTIISQTAAPELNEEVAVLVNALDEADIADGMGKIATNDVLRKRIAGAGLTRAASLTWEASTAKVIEIYNKVVSDT